MKHLIVMKPLISVFAITALAGSVLVTSGCSNDYNTRPSTTYHGTYYDPYDYYYYPRLSIYFHIRSGHYYYREGPHWKRVRKLPPRYHLDRNDRVRIRVNSTKPYVRHNDHTKRYVPHPNYKRDRDRDQLERHNNHRRHNEFRSRKQHKRR